MLTRRHFAQSLLAAPAAAALPFAPSPAAARPAASPGAVAPFRIGRFEVIALTDGHGDFPAGTFLGRDTAAIEADARALNLLREGHLRLSVTQYAIRDGDRVLLIDTGTGGGFPTSGRFPASLAAAGIAPADVQAVVLTHLHFDHIAGLVRGGVNQFPNAEVYADRRDIAHFTDPARRAASPEMLHGSFDLAAEVVRLAPRLQRTDGATRIADGITLVDLTGHTPGHIGVRIEDAGQSLLMVSDGLFNPAVHPRAEDVTFAFEQDPAAARAMRAKLFAEAEADGTLLAATHMPFPGLGRIGRDGDRRVWVPADWANL